jgi:hypothetical protein
MRILIVTPENERIQLSQISIAQVDAIIPGSAVSKQVAELTYRQFFCAFKREGFLLPEAHGSFMVKNQLSITMQKKFSMNLTGKG